MTSGQFRLWGKVDAVVNANTDDFTVTGLGSSAMVFLTGDGDYNITGIDAEAFTGGGNADLRVVWFVNDTTNRTYSFPGLTGSAAGNQFGYSTTPTISRGESIGFFYDADATKWKLLTHGRVPTTGGSVLPVDDATAIAKGSLDDTKRVRLECDTFVPGSTTVALAVPASNGTIAVVAGSDTQVLFNDAGASGADSAFTFDKTNDQLTATHVQVGGAINLAGDVAHTQTTGTVNNYNAGSSASWQAGTVFKINPSTGTVTLTGLEAPTSPKVDGRMIVLINAGTGGHIINLVNNSASSTNGNQFDIGTNVLLSQGEGGLFIYDTSADGGNGGWRCAGMMAPTQHNHSGSTTGGKIPATSVQTITMCVPFSVISTANIAENDMPSTPQFLRGSHRHCTAAPLSQFSEVMLVVNRQAAAATSGALMKLKYRSAFSTSIGDWLDIRDSGSCSVTLSAGTDTVLTSGWVTMASGAKIDPCYLCIETDDGNGADDPTFGSIMAFFRTT